MLVIIYKIYYRNIKIIYFKNNNMLNLKECGDSKKGKKIDSATLMNIFCFLLVLINHYSGGIN